MNATETEQKQAPEAIHSTAGLDRGCDCLQRIEKSLVERYGPVDMELSQWMDMKTFEPSMGLPPLRFSYHAKKKDGTPEKRATKGFVKFARCPFCGKPV